MLRPTRSGDTLRRDLRELLSKTLQRRFAEDVNYLESLGGDQVLLQKLHVHPKNGLDEIVVQERRRLYGSNAIKPRRVRSIGKFMRFLPKNDTFKVVLFLAVTVIVL